MDVGGGICFCWMFEADWGKKVRREEKRKEKKGKEKKGGCKVRRKRKWQRVGLVVT